MTFTRRILLASVAALTLGSGLAAAQENLTPISFRLDWSIYGSHAPFYLALENGMFEEAGLDVTIGEGQGSATVAQLITQGNDQIGFVDFGTMARGVEQGMPITAVARVISNVMCIISHADNPVNSPEDLSGKVVAFAPSESTALIFPALLASQDVDPDSVSVLNPAFGAKNAMLLQRRADAIPGNVNQQVAQIESQAGEVTYFLLSDYGVPQMNNGIVANDEFISSNPEAVRAFVAVTAEAFAMAEADPEAAVDALIAQLPQQERNRSVLLRQLELTFPSLTTSSTEGAPFGMMTDQDWEETQNVLVEYGGMPRSLPVEEYYTNEFIESE